MEYWMFFSSALWLGLMTSISPCPLTTNIAAVAYIGRQSDSKKMSDAFRVSFFYAFGRASAYLLVAKIVIYGFVTIPLVSFFLQKYMNIIMGPLMIFVGLFLLEMISFSFRIKGGVISEAWQQKLARANFLGSFALGFIFACAFCPVSAAIFFGGLIPLSIKSNMFFMPPIIYGVGTAIPVLIFSIAFVSGVKWVGVAFSRVTLFEKWLRKLFASSFIVLGIYLILKNIFEVL